MTISLILTFYFSLFTFHFSLQVPSPPPKPIIVDIAERETSDLAGLAAVLWGSLGLTGVLVLGSVLAAVVFAGVLFWVRSRAD